MTKMLDIVAEAIRGKAVRGRAGIDVDAVVFKPSEPAAIALADKPPRGRPPMFGGTAGIENIAWSERMRPGQTIHLPAKP